MGVVDENPHPDLGLARRLRAGDESAFESFFAECFPMLRRMALFRLDGDLQAAEDAAQTVLCRAIDKIGSYRGEASLLTWVCAVCRRELIDQRRRHERQPRSLSLSDDHPAVTAAIDELSRQAEGPEETVDRSESGERVRAALAALPVHYRQVLEWKYLEDLPQAVVGARLGVGQKAVESLLFRARAAFRRSFLAAISGPRTRETPR